MAPKIENKPARGGAVFVAAGILLSRFAGLIRERVFAHYFGNSAAGDGSARLGSYVDDVQPTSVSPMSVSIHHHSQGQVTSGNSVAIALVVTRYLSVSTIPSPRSRDDVGALNVSCHRRGVSGEGLIVQFW